MPEVLPEGFDYANTVTWASVQSFFVWDGALLDVYVFDTDIEIWQRLLGGLRTSNFALKYYVDREKTPIPDNIRQAFAQGEQASLCLSVETGGLCINSHFFMQEEIEFDIDPREVNEESFSALLAFLRFVGQHLQRRVVLTPEGGPNETLLAYQPDADGWWYADIPA